MDRGIIQVGQLPLDTDQLNQNVNVMQALGALIAATFGMDTICDGLQVTPTTVPSMAVTIGAGSIMTFTTVDTSGYGSLPINNTPCMKIGINPLSTNLNITAPGTAGYSKNYLIEAAFQENDIDPVILPFYNAANPTQVWSGPNNDGDATNTTRTQIVNLQAIGGTAQPTGTQPTPTPTSGYTPIAVVVVPYGTTTITSANISMVPDSFVGTKLGSLPQLLTSNLNLYVSNQSNASDNNSGMSPLVPFATIQGAWNYIIDNVNLNGFSVTINITAGTFAEVACVGQPAGYGRGASLNIVGAGSSTIIQSTGFLASSISATSGANITISNLTVNGVSGIVAGQGSAIIIAGGVTFGTMTSVMVSGNGGLISILGNCTISGNASSFMSVNLGGSIQTFGGPTFTLSGTPVFSQAFVVAQSGIIDVTPGGVSSFSGSAVGPKFLALLGGSIQTGGSGGNVNFFPGSSAGTVNAGTTYAGFYA